MSDWIEIPVNGRWVITDGGALSLTVPYTNGDASESDERDGDGWKIEDVMCRGVSIGAVQTELPSLEITFTCVRVDTDSSVTIEHVIHRKGTWASPTSTYSGPSSRTHFKAAWQTYDGASWNEVGHYKYCTIAGKKTEKSPANEISVKLTAHAYASDWRSVTIP